VAQSLSGAGGRLSQVPIFNQVFNMETTPFAYQGQSSPGQRTFEDLSRLNLDLGDVIAVKGMKMRGRMLPVIDANCDPVKVA
jgi:hypothetical protein